MQKRVFDLSGKLRGKSFRASNASFIAKNLAMQSVRKIIGKHHVTKELRDKVLDRL